MKKIGAHRFLDSSLIRVCDENAYRFFSVCVSMDADLYDFNLHVQENFEHEYIFYIKNSDLYKLKEASIKTGINFEVIKESGLFVVLKRNFKRKIFFISIFLAVISLYLMTLFIWQIKITGCVNRNEAEIMELINLNGFHYGLLKNKCDCEAIEEIIRNNFDDVLWVSAAIDGTGLFIQIKENTYLNDKLALNDETADLSSDVDGKIISIVTREGVPIVSIGDEVKKGDILISGVKEFVNDAGEIYKTEHVYADGDVIAEQVKSYEWKYSRNIKVRNYDSNKYGFRIDVLDKKVFEFEPDINENLIEVKSKDKILVIGNDFYLPVNVKTNRYRLYTLEKRTLSDEALTLLANIHYKMFCVREQLKGVDIIEKNATISFDKNYCTVKAAFVTHEKVGVHTAITVQPINEEIEELSN